MSVLLLFRFPHIKTTFKRTIKLGIVWDAPKQLHSFTEYSAKVELNVAYQPLPPDIFYEPDENQTFLLILLLRYPESEIR